VLLLALKITLAPALVAAATAVQRRFGDAVGGRLVGLPLTSLPLLLLLTLGQGSTFGARAATASLTGITAQVLLIWVFARSARLGATVAVGSCVAAFASATTLLALVRLSPVLALPLSLVALTGALVGWPGTAAPVDQDLMVGRSSSSSTVVRIVVTGLFTLLVTLFAGTLGANLAGLVGALPVLAIVMFWFTRAENGAHSAQQFARGVARGSYSVIAALAVLSMVLPTGHVALAFGAALAASIAAQCLQELVGRVRIRVATPSASAA
jgi:hypothetical protein